MFGYLAAKKVDVMLIGYLGFSVSMVKYILSRTDVHLCLWICEKSRWTREMQEICDAHGMKYRLVQNRAELASILRSCPTMHFLMYEFGLILPEDVTEKHCVINFHPGSLENNRGRTPIVRSILRGDSYTKYVAYRLTKGIDQGQEITSRVVPITQDMDSLQLKQRMEQCLPEMLNDVAAYLRDGQIHEEAGIYCPKVGAADYTLNLSEDRLQDVERKVLSQGMYDGAILDGRRIRSVETRDYTWTRVADEDGLHYEIRAHVVLHDEMR